MVPESDHRPASALTLASRAVELRLRTEQMLAETRAAQLIIAEARDRRRERRPSAADRALLQESACARLLARLQTMPVIEQAKGIIMAQSHCGEAEAFDLLRRASQRSNVPVRDLAARIVAKAAQPAPAATEPRHTPGG